MGNRSKALMQLGGWTKGDRLGHGGNGDVFRATHKDGRTGVIKLLRPAGWGGKRYSRFQDELKGLKNCADIPGVIPVLDSSLPVGPTKINPPWIVCEYAQPIEDALEASDLATVIVRVSEVATTLAAMHQRDVAHRDVKPDNLFVFGGRGAVGDFGLVDFQGKESVTTVGEKLGPTFYIAPEMLNDSATADGKAADVYSLAKTLWVLATGQKFPLPGEMKAAIPALTISKYVTDIRAALLDRLVEAATTFDPSTRPTMKEFASELEAWLRPSAGPAINELDLSGYASEIESINEQHYRREKLMSAEIEFKTREGERIRERLRPLANALFAALQRAKFIGPQIGIDNYSYGFYVRGYVASLKEPGEVNLVANGTIWINRDAPASAAPRPGWACVKCSYTVGNDRPRESWSEWCAFLLGGSKEDAELANLISMTEGALLPQVELVLRMSKGEKNA